MVTNTTSLIDIEWAESLVGLSMKVPDNWWVGYSGSNLHDGRIDSFDVVNQKWNLLLNTRDDDDLYLMNYSAVCEYSDKGSSTLQEYQLPPDPFLVGDDEIETADGTRYTSTPTEEWNRIDENNIGRTIDPIEWTGGNEEFTVHITDEEVKTLLMDDNKEIRFEKVFQWCLPRFGNDDDVSLFEFQAARMRNYMRKRMVEDNWRPKYYCQNGNGEITGDHVARYYGTCLAKMHMGNRSIDQIFCTREYFNAVPPIQESMTKNCLEDLNACLHYSDDWDVMGVVGCKWDDTYDDPKVECDPSTASHRLKYGLVEDAYNKVCMYVVVVLFSSQTNL